MVGEVVGAPIKDGEYLWRLKTGTWGGRGSCMSERQEAGKLRIG